MKFEIIAKTSNVQGGGVVPNERINENLDRTMAEETGDRLFLGLKIKGYLGIPWTSLSDNISVVMFITGYVY